MRVEDGVCVGEEGAERDPDSVDDDDDDDDDDDEDDDKSVFGISFFLLFHFKTRSLFKFFPFIVNEIFLFSI